MKINLYYDNQTGEKLYGYKKLFEKFATKVISSEKEDGIYELSLTITDNETIHKYNKEYRRIDRETDVLSFALLEADNINIKGIPVNVGDIIISLEKAKEQALEYNHSLKREICFLFVHGLLHLMGYDHMNKEDEEIMFAKQEQILLEEGIERK